MTDRSRYTGPGPCEFFGCPRISYCSQHRMACDAFQQFIATGRVLDPFKAVVKCGHGYNSGGPIEPMPSRKVFEQCYPRRDAA